MTLGKVLDPTSSRDDDIASPGPDAGLLAGKRIGFRVDNIWRCWDWISGDWAARLEEAGATTSFWRGYGRSGEDADRLDRELKEWLETIDVAIIGLANCGSCTGWTVRDAITAANTGIPTIGVATKNFEAFAHELAARGGRSGLRLHVLPYPLNEQVEADVKAIGDAHFDAMLDDFGAVLEMRDAAE